jgi:hypothetical protein
MRSIVIGFVGILLAGCSGAPPSSAAETFSVTANNALLFDATYRSGDDWARVLVRYSPDTTFYNLTTSFSSVPLAYAGTAPGDHDLVALLQGDPRYDDGFLTLSANDPEYAMVSALHAKLLALGTTARPTLAHKGTTLYAAAYTTARVLGQVHLIPDGSDPSEIPFAPPPGLAHMQNLASMSPDMVDDRDWPFPGYDSYDMLPNELLAPGDNQNFANNHCCGPHNCKGGNYWGGTACDDWCAAGDSCNNRALGGCGTICPCSTPGCGCPHSNSTRINSYTSGPCNTRPKSYLYHVYSVSPRRGAQYIGCH